MKFNIRKILFLFVVGSLVSTFFLLKDDNLATNISDIPLIHPEEGETKIRPIEPGGAEFPNMDKSVYEYITPSKKPLRNEQVMPEPEQPVLSVKQLETESVFETSDNSSSKEETNPSIFNETEQPLSIDTPVSDINIITVDQSDDRLTTNSTTSGRKNEKYKIQICASKTESQALSEWNKALKNNRDLISKYKYHVNKVDLGEKGLIYKLYIGPFNNYNEANSLCKRLIKRKQNCLVVND
jgi:hypothetical protein